MASEGSPTLGCSLDIAGDTKKMVPITGRARSFLVFFGVVKNKTERWGGQNNNRSINLLKVRTFFTDYKYTTYP